MDDGKFLIKKHELELKYDASNVKLSKFNEFARSLNPVKEIEVYSWDSYYANPAKNDLNFEFLRYRQGPTPELTIKEKTDDKNNNQRIEIDLPLDPNRCSEEDVAMFCERFNFKLNCKIFKWCSIFFYEKTDMVFYIVYDEEMKEKGRYVEIERRKDVPCNSAEEALAEVKELEKKLEVLGISPQMRMKKSQWELNRK